MNGSPFSRKRTKCVSEVNGCFGMYKCNVNLLKFLLFNRFGKVHITGFLVLDKEEGNMLKSFIRYEVIQKKF